MRDPVDNWIDDYSHMIEESEQEQKEHEQNCELVKYQLMQVAKLVEFYADLFSFPLNRSDEQVALTWKLIDNLNIDLRSYRNNFDE